MAERSLTMKLLIDTTTNKVLFAEAGKEEVDFLFSLLTLPLGSVVKLLTEEKMVGSVGSMYGSLERLDSTYFQYTNKKNLLLQPKVFSSSSSTHNTLPLLPLFAEDTEASSYYYCNYCRDGFYTDISGTTCPSCNRAMTNRLKYVDPETRKADGNAKVEGEGGYVKGVVTYTVMDDLTVTPMSTISSISLLNKFNVRGVDMLREETVKLGMQERLELLRVALQSKNVLTDVFLEKNNVNIVPEDVFPEENNFNNVLKDVFPKKNNNP